MTGRRLSSIPTTPKQGLFVAIQPDDPISRYGGALLELTIGHFLALEPPVPPPCFALSISHP